MFLANPSYLFALAGLLVPLAIHLWSKKEGKVIKIGSVQFLSEEDAKKSSSIRLNELWLLLLRMLLLAVLSFILAQLFYQTKAENTSKALFIDPELRSNKKTAELIDSLQENHEVYWFALGFPAMKETPDTSNLKTHYWQLLAMLDDFPVHDIAVVSQSKLAHLVGERPTIHRPISWITINEASKNEFIAETVSLENGYKVVIGESTNSITSFTNTSIQSLDQGKKENLISDTLRISFHVDKQYELDSIYIKAAIETIRDYTYWPIVFEANTKSANWLVWLSDQPVKEKIPNQLVWHADSLATDLIEETAGPNVYYLTAHLNQEIVVEKDFVTTLFQVLREQISDYKSIVARHDQRIAPDQQFMPTVQLAKSNGFSVNKPLNNYLWILLVLLFAGERTLAFYRNQ